MPVEVICEIADRVPQEDRPALFRTCRLLGDLYFVPWLRPDRIYASHLAQGYSVREVWDLIQDKVCHGDRISLPFPTDRDMYGGDLWCQFVSGLCHATLPSRPVYSTWPNWLRAAEKPSQMNFGFVPRTVTRLEIYGIPACVTSKCCHPLAVLALTAFLLVGNGERKSSLHEVELYYEDSQFEAWEVVLIVIRTLLQSPIYHWEIIIRQRRGDRELQKFGIAAVGFPGMEVGHFPMVEHMRHIASDLKIRRARLRFKEKYSIKLDVLVE